MPPLRPISGAERAAAGLALDYLSGGAAAWIPALSPSSRFFRLDRAQAEAELEARAGPPLGATWELQTVEPDLKDRTAVFSIGFPSGLETTLRLDLVQEGRNWKIRDVRILEEQAPGGDGLQVDTQPKVKPATGGGRTWVFVLFSVGGLLVAAGLVLGRRQSVARGLVVAGVVAVVGGVGVALLAGRPTRPPSEEKEALDPSLAASEDRLAPLREARKALATSEADAVKAVLAKLPTRGVAGQVGRLWKAQWALHDQDLNSAAEILHSFPAEARIAQVEILRARLAFLRNRPLDMVRFYEAALRLGPDHDGLLVEAALLSELMADKAHSDGFILEAAHNGSRIPDVSYAQAAYWIGWERGLDAENWFKRAWLLRPVERVTLFRQSVFWDLLRRPDLYASLRLDSPTEPTVGPQDVASSPIALPAGTAVHVCGSFLRLQLGSSRLNVPGGAPLAPAGTQVDDAGAWTHTEEREALADLPKLFALAESGGSLLQPLLRREIETAAFALAERSRWEDVVRLTQGVTDAVERAPSGLVVLRAEALRRADQLVQARELSGKMASSELFVRRSSAGQLLDLADILASLGDYDRGIQMAEKGSAKLRIPVGKTLIWRIKMERKLAASYMTYNSEHFSIRYPREHPESGTRKLAVILEGERERLRRWVPIQSKAKTEVQLLWYEDFEKAFSEGIEIVGLFDGKIRLPFAGGESLDFSHPAIVAVVTHELTHAMVAEMTRDSAPRWFQEGLAQHVEMIREHFNPIPLYEKRSRFLSLPVVEGVLEGLPAPDLAAASYEESLWMLHFLEATSGVNAIHRLIEAFRAGASTEEALAKLSYRSLSDFDQRFRQWCRLPESSSWKGPMLRYLGNRASDGELPASLRYSIHRIRWQQSEETFPPNEIPQPQPPQPSSRR